MSRTLFMPFQIGDLGVPRTAPRDVALRQQIEQLLFTLPGERVNRPDFGCGVQRLVFAGATNETAIATEYVIRVALDRYLRDVIKADAVRVTVSDATLFIDILYTVIETGDELAETFRRPLEGPS
ncbi:MAG: GPW/gp25 family protein [Byssovorax sp.]